MAKETVRITADIPQELDAWIEEFKEITGINKNRILVNALNEYRSKKECPNVSTQKK